MHASSSRIRKARSLAALSQTELARRVGVQRSAVTQWECEGGTLPSVEHLIAIALETGVFFEWIATGRGPCRPADGELVLAVATDEYAKDEYESRALAQIRSLSTPKKQAAIEILTVLAKMKTNLSGS